MTLEEKQIYKKYYFSLNIQNSTVAPTGYSIHLNSNNHCFILGIEHIACAIDIKSAIAKDMMLSFLENEIK